MAPEIKRITENHILAEGPHWDVATQSLYFVDCQTQNLIKYNSSTKKLTTASVAPKQPTFIIPAEGRKDQFLISLDNELVMIVWDGDNDKVTVIEKLCTVHDSSADNKLNDGKCDSTGRLWTGTYGISTEGIHKTPETGCLYSYDSKNHLQKHVDKIRISNGLAFNEQVKKMYHVDSIKRTVDQFDFDVSTGTISNRKVFFTFDKFNIVGFPDGMTIDTDGNLWLASFGGGKVLKIFGQKPDVLLDSIELPASQITSVTFGGPNLDELYVTTGCFEFEGQRPSPPENGATYKITGLGVKGFAGANFKMD